MYVKKIRQDIFALNYQMVKLYFIFLAVHVILKQTI